MLSSFRTATAAEYSEIGDALLLIASPLAPNLPPPIDPFLTDMFYNDFEILKD
jgi:hypothetical protein